MTAFSKLAMMEGVMAMTYKIEEREAIRVVGYKTFVSMEEVSKQIIPKLWDEFPCDASQNLMAKSNGSIQNIIGVNEKMHDQGFDYWIGVTSDEEMSEGQEEYLIPKCTWLIIEVKGALRPEPKALQEAYKNLFKEWLPNSCYEHAGYAEIEVYPMMGEDQTSEDYLSEIWVSIKKK